MGEACRLVFPLLKEFSCRCPFLPRNSVAERWTVTNPCLLLLDSRLFTGSCFIPHLSPRRAFQVVFREKRNASHEYFAPGIGQPCFQVWCSLAIHPLEKFLQCTGTAMALAVLTVEADGNLSSPDFLRQGCLFIAMMVCPTAC